MPDVTLLGATYKDVPAVDLPTTGGGTSSFFDVSDTTATSADVASGKVFYSATGVRSTGTASASGVSVFYGTCSTSAATAAKVVACKEFTSADLVAGTVVNVKFTNAQTYNGAPTLNVNSTGAKNVKRIGTTNAARYEWQAGEVLQFVYDGTYWMLTDGGIATTTYYGVTKLSSATNSTSTALAATASAVKAAYDLANGKQDALVSGTNIKTVNGNSLLGSGDITTPTYTLPTASTSTLGGVKVDGSTITIADGVISSSGGGGGVGLVINVVVDSSGNVVSHDAITATCLDFAQAAVNNSDASAVAYVRNYSYDDEDDVYSSYVYRLPLIYAYTNSYGGGQYAADGGIQLEFGSVEVGITGSSKMSIRAKSLNISTINDDPERPVLITYTDKGASSNS